MTETASRIPGRQTIVPLKRAEHKPSEVGHRPAYDSRQPTLQSVELGRLEVDPAYQRPLDSRRVALMAADFNLYELASVRVNIRKDGRAFIIDGQQRIGALRLCGFGPNDLVEVLVQHGLTPEQEAKEFVAANLSVKVRPYDVWRARTEAGEPVAVEVNAILGEFGLKFGQGGSEGQIQTVSTVERIYTSVALATQDDRGPAIGRQNRANVSARLMAASDKRAKNAGILRATLRVLYRAFGRASANYQEGLLTGVATLLTYGEADEEKLVETLRRWNGGAIQIIAASKGLRALESGSPGMAVAKIIAGKYNSRTRGGAKIDVGKLR